MFLLLEIFYGVICLSQGSLPPGCLRLEEQPLDNTDPGTIFGTNSELNTKATPARVGNLRRRGALPTGHFITNQIKDHPVPLRLFPYEAVMTREGITYDAYTMERWWDPKRTDEMQQQSAWQAGQPWHKLTSMGTNLKQMVSGPDGNPTATFSGKSGVMVGIAGAGEPEITDFGDLYANVVYSGNGGSMEIPIVRGAPLLTHIFRNANPVIKPLCLSSFDGHQFTFDCPKENSVADIGSGYLTGSCTGNTLHIQVIFTKPLTDDVNKLQWAASTKSAWRNGLHTMVKCDPNTCRLSKDRTRVDIIVPNMSGLDARSTAKVIFGQERLRKKEKLGIINFAVNYIGYYTLPSDWVFHPDEVNCFRKRELVKERSIGEISFCATCHPDRTVDVNIYLGPGNANLPLDYVQIALASEHLWSTRFGMVTCTSLTCEKRGYSVHSRKHVNSNVANVAVNIIGMTTLPYSYWMKYPCQLTCGGPSICTGRFGRCSKAQLPTAKPLTPKPTTPPTTTSTTTQTTTPSTTTSTTTTTTTTTTTPPPPTTTTPMTTSTTPSTTTTTTPPTTTTTSPTTTQQAHNQAHIPPGQKFILELNEPGNGLPNQTRKFLIFFSQFVTVHFNKVNNTITFEPLTGAKYNGIMQLAYLGAGARGDHSNDTVLDNYLGVYSYKPKASYCVSEFANTAYANFDWRPNMDHAESITSQLLMVTLPHHAILLGRTSPDRLRDTVYTFKGYEGDSWLLEMELPRASMEPDSAAVHTVQQNQQQLQDILAAIDRDVKYSDLNRCSTETSYEVGRSVSLFARLGSISRAFNTSHYVTVDYALKNCLEKWLRIDDSLDDIRKFKYDLVWGGLFLRGTNGDLEYGTDNGFPYYSNHHFHLGYFLYAIAYVVKNHPDWGHEQRSRIYTLARDVGNPSYNDKYFPVARHKDVFMGFSWATGVVPGQRQEESSSEAINCYHGLAALGEAYSDNHLKHTGQVLLAMEILSAREYWHVRSHNEAHFPPTLRGYGVVGQIAEDDFYVYSLNEGCSPDVFPMRHGCFVGTQVMPITAVSTYWMDKDWASHILQTCSMAVDPTQARDYHLLSVRDIKQLDQGWKAFCYAAMAPYDAGHARMAAEFVKHKTPRDLVGGTGAASTLLFIFGRT